MRKIFLIIAGALLLLGVASYYASTQVPDIANKQTLALLKEAGFNQATLPEPQIRFAAMRYDRINLDPDGLSTIKRIEIHYNPLSVLLFGSFQRVQIEGLKVTGERAENGDTLIFGWTNPGDLSGFIRARPGTLLIEKSTVSVLDKKLGGIFLDFDLQIRTRGKTSESKGTFKLSQKNINLSGNTSAHLDKSGAWTAGLEVEQGKFTAGPLKATRVNGVINSQGQNLLPPAITGDLRAGGITLYDFPWQNAVAKFEYKDAQLALSSTMNSVGISGVDLNLNLSGALEALNVSGAVHTQNLGALLGYLEAQNVKILNEAAVKTLVSTGEAFIEFTSVPANTENATSLTYKIKNKEKDIGIDGTLSITDKQNFSGTLSSEPFSLGSFELFLRQAEKGQNLFSSGTIKLSSEFNGQNGKFDGSLKTDVSNGVFSVNGVGLKNIKGSLVLDPFAALSTAKPADFSCSLMVPVTIPQSCRASAAMNNGVLQISNLDLSIFNTDLTATNVTFGKTDQKLTLESPRLDLWELTKGLKIDGLSATGTAQMNLPLTLAPGSAQIRNGSIRSLGPGVIRVRYDTDPQTPSTESPQEQLMRRALENYNYDNFEITINTVDGKNAEIIFSGNGSNPGMQDGQNIPINLKTKAPLAPLFKNLQTQ